MYFYTIFKIFVERLKILKSVHIHIIFAPGKILAGRSMTYEKQR